MTSADGGAAGGVSGGTSGGGYGVRWWAAVVLSAGALLLTGYLTIESLAGDGRPAGCGDPSAGCGAVLNTKWSKVFGLPVSGLAVGVYVVLLGALLVRGAVGGRVQAVCGAAILGAGVWFTYLQVFELEAVCVYCMTDHAIGAAVALLVLSGTAVRQLVPAVVVGVVGTAGLAAIQFNSSEPVFIETTGGGEREGQTLTLLDGRLTLDLDEEMVIVNAGENSGAGVMVKMFDYNCPHCRKAYEVSRELEGLATVLLPVPLNPDCNPYSAKLPLAQFDESCGLARVAVALYRVDASALPAFEAWAYGEGWPHTAADAEAFAATLVDGSALAAALADPAVDAAIARNSEAWGAARDADLVGGLPVHLVPGGGLTYGGVGDGTGLRQLLAGTHYTQTGEDEDF
ncbi:MAG: vitamin K epoxide reductase family protein [Planctomycetota bacterium]